MKTFTILYYSIINRVIAILACIALLGAAIISPALFIEMIESHGEQLREIKELRNEIVSII